MAVSLTHIALSGQQLLLRGVSTPGHGQGEGPVGSKLSRRDDADDDGRGRSERSERSPLRSKLLTLLLSTHNKKEDDPFDVGHPLFYYPLITISPPETSITTFESREISPFSRDLASILTNSL